MEVIKHAYKWAYPLTTRSGPPRGVVWHNAAATNCTADAIHQWHLANGWCGIAYHFFVEKEGRVIQGRPESKLGGHALGASSWIGICFEGNYDREQRMPEKQFAAGHWLHNYLADKYGRGLKDVRHRDMPGNATSCPGKYFPFAALLK